MTRIHYRLPALLCGSLAAAGVTAADGKNKGADPKRPNILVLIADDISRDDFGCYGHPGYPHAQHRLPRSLRSALYQRHPDDQFEQSEPREPSLRGVIPTTRGPANSIRRSVRSRLPSPER